MFHYMNEKEVTFNVKYEIVLYTPVFNARWPWTLPGPPGPQKEPFGAQTNPFWDQIWHIGALRGPRGPPQGPFEAKTSLFRAPLSPEGA